MVVTCIGVEWISTERLEYFEASPAASLNNRYCYLLSRRVIIKHVRVMSVLDSTIHAMAKGKWNKIMVAIMPRLAIVS